MLLNNKYAIFSLFMLFSNVSYGMYDKSIQIKQENLLVPQSLGNISLYHDDEGFKIANEYGIKSVKPYHVDKELRGLSQKNLAKVITVNSYISVKELNDGEDYSLKLDHRINGGGPIGAGVGSAVGYFLTWGIWEGIIAISTCWIPEGDGREAAKHAMRETGKPFIDPIAKTAAAGCGLLGGVITGPV